MTLPHLSDGADGGHPMPDDVPTVTGYIAWHMRQNPTQAKALGDSLMTAALQGDSVAGLACILSVLLAEESEDDDGEAWPTEEDPEA